MSFWETAMTSSSILEEVRDARAKLLAEHGGDAVALFAAMCKATEAVRRSGGRVRDPVPTPASAKTPPRSKIAG